MCIQCMNVATIRLEEMVSGIMQRALLATERLAKFHAFNQGREYIIIQLSIDNILYAVLENQFKKWIEQQLD